jgi:MFS family permease
VVVNAFVGAMVGIERTVLPLLAEAEFGVASASAALAFIATFGVTKATTNLFAGALSERWGRRPLLVAGWIVGLPVPFLLMHAPAWSWILWANVLLGVNQSLTWSMTVVMKVDLATPRTYGLVIGWNEFAGYAGMALAAAATGFVGATWGLRPQPFQIGIGVAALGLLLSLFARETSPLRATVTPDTPGSAASERPGFLPVLARGSWTDPALSSASRAGLATNLKDGALWGLLPVLLAGRGLPVARIGAVVALYPLVWAVSQLFFGPASDRYGRRGLITVGLAFQAAGVAGFLAGTSLGAALAAACVTGLGTGMVYPTLLAFVSDRSEPAWRATALGVYRLWRDLGYAVGALTAGLLADALGVDAALAGVVVLLSGAAFVFVLRARDG